VTFLECAVGGPTVIFDQTVARKETTRAWVAPPKRNRLLAFDGSRLHGVLPGAGAGAAGGRRLTFMANFWATDPCAGDAADPENTRGATPFPPAGARWPADFIGPREPFAAETRAKSTAAVDLGDIVQSLDGAPVKKAPDLISDGTFFDCLEILGCEARSAATAPQPPPASTIRDALARFKRRRQGRAQ